MDYIIKTVIYLVVVSMCLSGCGKEEQPENTIKIACIGDSLTVGAGGEAENMNYPDELRRLLTEAGIAADIEMLGVGGEDTVTIIGRTGGTPYVLTEDLVINPGEENIIISFASEDGSKVTPLLQGREGMEYIIAGGIKGTVIYGKESYSDEDFTYYFTPQEAVSDMVTVEKGTPIITRAYEECGDYIPVIFMGENGGYGDCNELIEQIMSIIQRRKNGQEEYIVIGLVTGDEGERAELEQAMEEAFGKHYLNIREYLCEAFYDTGIIPTDFDEMLLAKGAVPGSLHSDAIHLNADGYRLVARAVYEKLIELGYCQAE